MSQQTHSVGVIIHTDRRTSSLKQGTAERLWWKRNLKQIVFSYCSRMMAIISEKVIEIGSWLQIVGADREKACSVAVVIHECYNFSLVPRSDLRGGGVGDIGILLQLGILLSTCLVLLRGVTQKLKQSHLDNCKHLLCVAWSNRAPRQNGWKRDIAYRHVLILLPV